MGTKPIDLSLYQKLKLLYRHEIAKLKLMPKNLLKGEEIMKICNITEGQKVGEILKELRDLQLSHELKTKDEAKKYLQKKYSSKASS